MALIRVEEVVKEYIGLHGVTRVLDGVSLELEQGDVLAVVGKSGCGKTTLLNLLGGLDSPTAGKIFFDDCWLGCLSQTGLAKYRNEKVGYLFQSYLLQLRRTAAENVVLPLLLAGKPLRQSLRRAHEALEEVGLAHVANQRVAQLSGGQKQRVALARAIVNKPPLLLVDEPTGNLDTVTSLEIFELLLNYRSRCHATIVIVTHDPLVEKFKLPLMTLAEGKLVPHLGRV
ncbi:MAG: ABC transporter ATP-binding protein [Candidatus Sumerlaeaceae bacterium]|nr:ABC transporter ATP-binding protein [Candidatus Sumerlaeaceae bacterium]